jgi:hypothetical protein
MFLLLLQTVGANLKVPSFNNGRKETADLRDSGVCLQVSDSALLRLHRTAAG